MISPGRTSWLATILLHEEGLRVTVPVESLLTLASELEADLVLGNVAWADFVTWRKRPKAQEGKKK